ncbi:putative sulfoacetate transporter SauU [Gimesia panareensis]|uniref:Putative sulfoacetate transporter SauU n=1 Tax=Gimesia panareensis TaxID=2527978 RepID=A0A518FI15_9PLAN|nr:MFS transporter [Gimesia panareensis]QDV15997.1 putative sulfoacetate transporter SauU [Gimesia panareensis]
MDSAAASSPSGEVKPTRVRFLVLAGLSSGFLLAYLPRAGLAPLNTTIQADLTFDDLQMGRVLAAFYAGYFLFQIPGGILGQKLGNRLALPLLQLISAIANLLTAVAHSFGLIWFSRLLLGLAQAGMVPCSAQVIKNWIPEAKRGTASSLMGSFMSVGSIIATGLTASLVGPLGWRIPLVLFSLFSLCWMLLFFLMFRDRPEEHPGTNEAEVKLILSSVSSQESDSQEKHSIPVRQLTYQMVSNGNLWLFCLQCVFRSFGYAFFITWFPAYLQQSSDASVKKAGLLAMLPLMAIVLGTLAGGRLIDLIYQRTGSKYFSRSLLSAGSTMICAVCILLASQVPANSAVYLISCGTFLSGMGNPAIWVTSMDLGGRHTSVIIAIVNMAGVFGGYLSPIVVGALFTYIKGMPTPDWNQVLYLFTGIYLGATLSWILINPSHPVTDDESQQGT